MRNLPRRLACLLPVVVLSACGSFQGPACPLGPPCPPPAGARAPQTLYGVVYSVLQVRPVAAGNSAAAQAVARSSEHFHVTIQLKDGSRMIVEQPAIGPLRLGDRVRIDDGEISRY